ncbi:DUF6931 family protein [Porphyrobacter sp. AAP60]|uniref:DUF6931 family protein n=1 Tax=Porphyrobacter sp. AAP60 TaxID=1523423 RepID=UPI0006B9585B|nr:hypothetical protein [Porphyrobacter sp. AAP60]KPF63520.1 hypothetical protein IP79_06175 [Porphyrobacter sp. AAP60]
MTDWNIVFWSSARQIAEEAKLARALWPDEDVSPDGYFRDLRTRGEVMAAITYVAAALPKLEAIDWALSSLPPLDPSADDFAARMLVRDTIQRWLGEPDDENRRAVERLVEQADRDWPETLIGLAVFFSGGSIAPEDTPPVPAEPGLMGQLIAGAIQSVIAAGAAEGAGLSGRILDLADQLATNGRKPALTP